MTAERALFLDVATVQIRYAFGHTYLDRCGQTMVDIERMLPEWIPGEVKPTGGNLVNAKDNFSAVFGNDAFTLTAQNPEDDLDLFVKHAGVLWKAIRANLGLDELVRLGARFQYLQPRKSVEDAEKGLKSAELNVQLPPTLSDFVLSVRGVVIVLERASHEYRVELKGITRTESIPPVELLAVQPKLLSKGQKAARLEMLKRRAQYAKDPMYAILLDVDCVRYSPDSKVRIEDFVREQYTTVIRDFLPIIQRINR